MNNANKKLKAATPLKTKESSNEMFHEEKKQSKHAAPHKTNKVRQKMIKADESKHEYSEMMAKKIHFHPFRAVLVAITFGLGVGVGAGVLLTQMFKK